MSLKMKILLILTPLILLSLGLASGGHASTRANSRAVPRVTTVVATHSAPARATRSLHRRPLLPSYQEARVQAQRAAARARAVAALRAARLRQEVARRVTTQREATRRASSAKSKETGNTVAWARSRFAIQVANCESGDLQHWPYSTGDRYIGNPHLRDANGHYGKWQFDLSTWQSVGGSGNPADASEAEQDMRAEMLYKQRGWQPWECASILTR